MSLCFEHNKNEYSGMIWKHNNTGHSPLWNTFRSLCSREGQSSRFGNTVWSWHVLTRDYLLQVLIVFLFFYFWRTFGCHSAQYLMCSLYPFTLITFQHSSTHMSPGGGNGNPLQYSCLENSVDRGIPNAYSPLGCKELDTTEWLSTYTHYSYVASKYFIDWQLYWI